jgi:hypothetical protein
MLAQYRVLDERLVVLLIHWHEHAHDIPDQVRAALRHAVQKHRFEQWRLSELRIQLVQIVSPGDNSRQNRLQKKAGTRNLVPALI